MKIRFKPDGSMSFTYDEKYASLQQNGKCKMRRVSDVEPTEDGRWTADMTKLGPTHAGVVLGPFDHRSQALAAEVKYIEEHS